MSIKHIFAYYHEYETVYVRRYDDRALRISIWLEIRVFLLLGKEKKCKGLEEGNIHKVP